MRTYPFSHILTLLGKSITLLKTNREQDHCTLDFVKDICILLPPRFLPCISEIAAKLSYNLANFTKAMFLSAQRVKISIFSTLPKGSKTALRVSILQDSRLRDETCSVWLGGFMVMDFVVVNLG